MSFANTLIVLTTNLGSRVVQKGAAGGASLGFGAAEDSAEASYENVKELVHEEMKTFFRPEFLNRLDETIVFRPAAGGGAADQHTLAEQCILWEPQDPWQPLS